MTRYLVAGKCGTMLLMELAFAILMEEEVKVTLCNETTPHLLRLFVPAVHLP